MKHLLYIDLFCGAGGTSTGVNGITFREAMRKVRDVNGLCLPDEEPKNLFTYQL